MSTQTAAALDPAQVDRYHADGFLVLRSVFAHDRIAELGAEADRLLGPAEIIDTNNIRCRYADYGKTATYFR